MKPVGGMSIGELAAFVCTHLKDNGSDVVFSGGACVSIYTKNRYQSYDQGSIDENLRELVDFFSEIIALAHDAFLFI